MKIPYQQLKIEDREKIAIFRAEGRSVRQIAKELNRHHSTIVREIKRNGAPVNYGYYLPSKANERAMVRKQNAGIRPRLKSQIIRSYVQQKLNIGWSPEQITGRISMEMHGVAISHEAIYQYIYAQAPLFIPCLPRKHRKRYRKHHSKKHSDFHIPNRVPIQHRPAYINRRLQFGHWESDSVVSKKDLACLNVLVERKSRLVQISKIPNSTARENKIAICRKLSRFPLYARRSITYDNGHENVHHEWINKKLNTSSFFCQPFHSWEKGTVENTNGLIRRFIRKGTEIAPLRPAFIRHIEFLLNNRPRKCLEFHTPAEVFNFFGGALAP